MKIKQIAAATVIGSGVVAGMLGFGGGTAIAATGSSAGPDYSVLVGEWGVSRQAGESAAAPIVRESIEMDGNMAPLGTVGCGGIADSDTGANQIAFSKVIVCD